MAKKKVEGAAASEAEPIRYNAAIEELERLLSEIEGDGIDLDDLGARVERAAELIGVCRDKIERAEMQVRRIVETLDAEPGA